MRLIEVSIPIHCETIAKGHSKSELKGGRNSLKVTYRHIF